MTKYRLTIYDGYSVCDYTGDEQYPFYYKGEPFYFDSKQAARKVMQAVKKRFYGSRPSRFAHNAFMIVEIEI